MSIALVQTFYGSFNSSTWTSPGSMTATINIPNSITPGNCIVVFSAVKNTTHHASTFDGVAVAPSFLLAPSANWRQATGNQFNESTTVQVSHSINYLQNAPSGLSAGTTLTVTFSTGGSGNVQDVVGEFAVYEFSGVKTNVNPSLVLDAQRAPNSTGSGVPSAGTLTLSIAGDLVLAGFIGDTVNCTAGSGYSLGINMVQVTFSTMQYNLSGVSGGNATAFGSGSQANYRASAAGLFAAPAPSATPVNFGSIIGA
jgi:hypothetical protein